MTSTQNIQLSVILCLIGGSLLAVSSDHASALRPTNHDNKGGIPSLQPHKSHKAPDGPDIGEPLGSSPLDNFDMLFEPTKDTVPDLISLEPTILTDPLHTTIKDNIIYIQHLGSIYGGEDSGDTHNLGSSGYTALSNGLISLEIPLVDDTKKAELLNKMHDPSIRKALFAYEGSAWRSSIIQRRIENTLKGYIEDQLLGVLSGTHEIPYREITSMDFYLLQTKKAVIVINDDIVDPQRSEIDYLARLIPGAAQIVAHAHAHKGGSFSIAPGELSKALEQEATFTKSKSSLTFEKRFIDSYLAHLPTLSGQLITEKNHNEVRVAGKTIYTQEYGPTYSTELNGSWPSSLELKELAEREFKNPTDHLANLKGKYLPVRFLEFSEEQPLEERLTNSVELNWLRAQFEKKPTEFTALFLIAFEKEWSSCLITKNSSGVMFTVTDAQNKDRHTEKGIRILADTIQEGLSAKASSDKKKKQLFNDALDEKEPEADAKKAPGVNYDAPLANLRDDELPSLEDFFGDKIPNEILVCIKQLKKEVRKGSVGEKLKNGFLLYGPPGTGKSTIAQVMARKAGRSIVYAGGGDFRDAYQGSGKAKLDALFAEAKKRGNCIILIDEIDGTTNKLQPHNSTQEDNRAIKSLITTLDQYRYDPDIYVICTTNYPENIDPAIMRRFKRIEIPLPDYPKRRKIINYYLKRNGTQVVSRTPHALSPDFYDKLISATEGFSGDALGDMINNAVYEYEEGLEPEAHINLDFRTKGIDLHNKSLLSNLGEILLLPLTPFFMMVGESDLDKHVYSQYKRQLKIQADIKENERKNDPNDKYAKEPFFTRLFKRNVDNAGTAFERGFWDLIIRHGWKRTFRAAGLNINDI